MHCVSLSVVKPMELLKVVPIVQCADGLFWMVTGWKGPQLHGSFCFPSNTVTSNSVTFIRHGPREEILPGSCCRTGSHLGQTVFIALLGFLTTVEMEPAFYYILTLTIMVISSTNNYNIVYLSF